MQYNKELGFKMCSDTQINGAVKNKDVKKLNFQIRSLENFPIGYSLKEARRYRKQ